MGDSGTVEDRIPSRNRRCGRGRPVQELNNKLAPRIHAPESLEFEPWPFQKLDLQRKPGPKGSAVLLTTGAMNPLHQGHIVMLHQACDRLEADGIAVLGAFLSPSHDNYILQKTKRARTLALSATFRLHVAQQAVRGDPLVSVGAWEAQQRGGWPDFPEVCAALQLALDSLPETQVRGRIECFYVCGSDHANKCMLWNGDVGDGVVVVPRMGDRLYGSEDTSRRCYVATPTSDNTAALSSTRLRAAIQQRDAVSIEDALSPAAVSILLHPGPEEYLQFQQDYLQLGIKQPQCANT
eukprot:6212220-Pleurochrysis_carterae.AAC.3